MKNVEYKDYYDMSAGTVEVRYPPYTLWKISATQSFGSHVRLSLVLDNIFNYKPPYYYLNSPLTAGATFTAGISVGLGCLVGSFFHLCQAVAHPRLGRKYPHGHPGSDSVLDSRGNSRPHEPLSGNMDSAPAA